MHGNVKLEKLEAIRGAAAVYVVFHHVFTSRVILFNIDFSILFKFGQEAVILFFILSGFVIQYSQERTSDKSFKTFFLKRFLRIYIPLIIVFITHYFVQCITIAKGFFPIDYWILLGNLLMLQDSFLKPNVLFGTFLDNSPLWSLSYEWWFYFLFYFIFYKFKNKASAFVYIIGNIAALTYLIYPNFINRELMYLIIWWIGADMARLYLNEKEINILNLKTPLIALGVCILILFSNILIQDKINLGSFFGVIGVSPWLEFRHFAFAFIAILIAVSWKKINWLGFSITFGVFTSLAPISFGIYISHRFLIVDANYLNSLVPNVYLKYACYFIVCMFFSYIVERVIYVKLRKLVLDK